MSVPLGHEVVIIDDDDETREVTMDRRKSSCPIGAAGAVVVQEKSTSHNQQAKEEEEPEDSVATAVAILQQILPHCSSQMIVQQLRFCKGNLEETANRLLLLQQQQHHQQSRQKTKKTTKRSRQLFLHPSTFVASRSTTTATGGIKIIQKTNKQQKETPTKRRLFPNETVTDQQAKQPKTSVAAAAAAAILPQCDQHHSQDEKKEEQQWEKEENLSPTWLECYNRGLQEDDQIFVDSDFPPMSSSLDGRLLRQPQGMDESKDRIEKKTTQLSTTNVIQYCRCGLPAAARQVQSDGPNYGRFYLCCGQVLRQKRRSAVAVVQVDSTTSTTTGSDSPRKQPCQFFQWDKDGTTNNGYASSTTRFRCMGWQSFAGSSLASSSSVSSCDGYSNNKFCLYKHTIGPEQVQQGAIGNCWFLSALAVVAEKPYLVQKLLPHKRLNPVGVYQVNLCLDGVWQDIIIDSHLPVIYRDISDMKNNTSSRKKREGIPVLDQPGIIAVPAFCATPEGQLWPALVEKAYAKAHGSYQQLSGGFIAEGLSDLTGAPCETILFDTVDADFFWARLLSFVQTGFCMGVATSGRSAQQGLVGGHAYSILDVLQLDNIVVGEQSKLTDYFGPDKASSPHRERKKETVRLVRIRNPWGTKEWKGDWSAKSMQWTHRLRQRLPDSWKQGDGTFFMSFQDMLQSFHHMDVCKTQPGWYHTTCSGDWSPKTDPLGSSRKFYRLDTKETTNAFISLIQPKKRSHTTTAYWYADPSLVVLRRRIGSDDWTEVTSCYLSGIQRCVTLDMFLEPNLFEYMCVPFSCGAQHEVTPFRLVVYSAKTVTITGIQASPILTKTTLPIAVDGIHRQLIFNEKKLTYTLAQNAVLMCSLIEGGCYFVGLNASPHFISLRLTIECPPGILSLFGDTNAPALDIPPGTQRILCILSGSGKSGSTATQFPFRYMSSVETRSTGSLIATKTTTAVATSNYMRSAVPICIAGEALVHRVSGEAPLEGHRGEDTVDTYTWIPQIGSLASASSSCCCSSTGDLTNSSPIKVRSQSKKSFKVHSAGSCTLGILLICLCVFPEPVQAKRKRPAPKRTIIEGRKLRDLCETQICSSYLPEENLNCISVCLSPSCFQQVYGESPLEDGEIDFVRAKLFDECFLEEIRVARQRKKRGEL
jgi:hypothetical protein